MTESLADRIKARLDLISQWATEGIPESVTDCPTSLNGWRLYHRPDLGILRIGSKSSFTTTDPDFGTHVRTIMLLNEQLKAATNGGRSARQRHRKRAYKPEKLRRLVAEAERDAFGRMVAQVTAQWHEARNELQAKMKSLKAEERRNLELRQTVEELRRRIADLESRSGLQGSVRSVP